MLGWLALCLAFDRLCRLLRRENPWPRIFLGGIAWLAGVEVTVAGERTGRGSVLLANHVSWIDIPAIAAASGAAFVAHEGLAAVPLLRWLCRLNDTVFVARHDRAGVPAQIAQVRAAIGGSRALAIFPEGTTSDGATLLPFKSSLLSALDASAGIVVRPVWLDYGADTAEIAWVGEEPGLDNFLRVLARWRPIGLTVHLLPPLIGPDLASRKTVAKAAREEILREMERSKRQRVAL